MPRNELRTSASSSLSWVIFDLDGTLVETEQIWRDVRHDFVIAQGGRWRDDAQTTMMGMRTAEWSRYIHDDLHVALPTNDIADRVIDLVKERLAKGVPIIPGAVDALQRLAPRFTLGLATAGAPAYAKTVLTNAGWEKLFSVVVYADEVARGKPAPDVYLRALKLMEADVCRTAAIEDSGSGIKSAHAAGTAVVAIPNREFPPAQGALSLAACVLNNIGELNVNTIEEALKQRR